MDLSQLNMEKVEKEVLEDRPFEVAMEGLLEDCPFGVVMEGGVILDVAESLPSLPWGFSLFLQGKDIISPFS